MQRAREACSLRNFGGILPNVNAIVQTEKTWPHKRGSEPSSEGRVLHDDRLHAFGPGGDEADFGADLL